METIKENPTCIAHSVRISSPQHSSFNEKRLCFDELPPEWKRNLEKEDKKHPTPIQELTFHPIQEGFDILAQSVTGSGKTLAFSLPLAYKLTQKNGRDFEPCKPQVLILTPTRELAEQISRVFAETLRPSQLRVTTVIGGVSYSQQERALSRRVHVVVGTPGRMKDLIERKMLDLDQIESLVLDEVDQMLDIGFAKELSFIRSQLPAAVQTLFFSATLNREAVRLATQLLKQPVRIEIDTQEQKTPQSIEHGFIAVKPAGKLTALNVSLAYHNPHQAIIFCETKLECADVFQSLSASGFNVVQLHSDLTQRERQIAMGQFKKGQMQYLVATNVAARGIDVQNMPLVINYTPPKDADSYTHRVGRTGRAGAKGKAWTLVGPGEYHRYLRLLKQVSVKAIKVKLPQWEDVVRLQMHREVEKLRTASVSSYHLPAIEELLAALSTGELQLLLQQYSAKQVDYLTAFDAKDLEWQEKQGFGREGLGHGRKLSSAFGHKERRSNKPRRPGRFVPSVFPKKAAAKSKRGYR